MIIPYSKNLKEPSKKLRSQPTEAERHLWKRIKGKHLGLIFHRQKPIGGYIVDFYCPEARLVIEVDGGYHLGSETKSYDKVKDETLCNLGLKVERFTNEEVLNRTDDVVERIKKSSLTPPLTRSDNPLGHDVKS
jgi:very-short-patch-repair endonuclease